MMESIEYFLKAVKENIVLDVLALSGVLVVIYFCCMHDWVATGGLIWSKVKTPIKYIRNLASPESLATIFYFSIWGYLLFLSLENDILWYLITGNAINVPFTLIFLFNFALLFSTIALLLHLVSKYLFISLQSIMILGSIYLTYLTFDLVDNIYISFSSFFIIAIILGVLIGKLGEYSSEYFKDLYDLFRILIRNYFPVVRHMAIMILILFFKLFIVVYVFSRTDSFSPGPIPRLLAVYALIWTGVIAKSLSIAFISSMAFHGLNKNPDGSTNGELGKAKSTFRDNFTKIVLLSVIPTMACTGIVEITHLFYSSDAVKTFFNLTFRHLIWLPICIIAYFADYKSENYIVFVAIKKKGAKFKTYNENPNRRSLSYKASVCFYVFNLLAGFSVLLGFMNSFWIYSLPKKTGFFTFTEFLMNIWDNLLNLPSWSLFGSLANISFSLDILSKINADLSLLYIALILVFLFAIYLCYACVKAALCAMDYWKIEEELIQSDAKVVYQKNNEPIQPNNESRKDTTN